MFSSFEDNQSVVQLTLIPVLNSNSKHTDIHRHVLRNFVHKGDISAYHVLSKYQHEDMLKALAFDIFAIQRRFLMNLNSL